MKYLLPLALLLPLPAFAQAARPDLAPYAGTYTAESGFAAHITFGAGNDLLTFSNNGQRGMDRDGEDSFAGGARRIIFEREGGIVTRARLEEGGAVVPFVRQPAAFTQTEIAFASDVALSGTLFTPNGSGPFPAIVMIHGSGDSDRDSLWYQRLARLLAESGTAVLLPDKRGSGRSGGDWQSVGFEPLAHDAIAGVHALAAMPNINPKKIGVLGVSQGGWIAPLAAERDSSIAFVVDLVGAAVTPREQTRLEVENTLRAGGLPPEGVTQLLTLQELGFNAIASGQAGERYTQLYNKLLATPLAPAVKQFPAGMNDPTAQWWSKVIHFDPLPHWRAIARTPSFVAYGAEDEKDNVPVAESVRRLEAIGANRPGSPLSVRVYPGVGHSLANGSTFHPGFVRDLKAFLAERAR